VKFNFKLELEKLECTFNAERIYRSKQVERFKILLVGSNKFVIIQSDRPNIEAKNLSKPINWHKVEGHIENAHTLKLIYQAVEEGIRNQPPPFQGTLNFNTSI
jgi:hypothetical protein